MSTVKCKPSRTPSYRLHKPTGLAVVTISGRDVYLGKHNSAESRAEYDRVLAEWLGSGRRGGSVGLEDSTELSVNEMLLGYLDWADGYYLKNGEPTTEPVNIRLALRPLRKLYGHTPAKEFGPKRLKTVRDAMVESDLCRSEVNKRVRHVLRAFKWAVAEEMVPPSVHHGLKAVSGLRRGRADVRESAPVKPVPDAFVDAIKPYVSRQVWTMIELQRLTGMRPGEVCILRTCDIDMTGRIWVYTPESHKTEHHGRERKVYFGPVAQEILRPWLREDLTDYLFSPIEAQAERNVAKRETRKSKVQPSQKNRRKRKPRKAPGIRYTPDSYRGGIDYGINSVNRNAKKNDSQPIDHWHPHQLRHNAATRLRKEFGLDTASGLGTHLHGRDGNLRGVGSGESVGGYVAGWVNRTNRLGPP